MEPNDTGRILISLTALISASGLKSEQGSIFIHFFASLSASIVKWKEEQLYSAMFFLLFGLKPQQLKRKSDLRIVQAGRQDCIPLCFTFKARQMERTALKSLLTHLCANSPWKYAVFWKLKHMLLTWEDGYCDYTKQKKSFKGKPDPSCSSAYSKILSLEQQPGVSDGSSTDFSIGFAIGYMSCLQYAVGKGVIGRAALTGDDLWTILLVPLLPHGVLQLGSFEKVDEDLSAVSKIRDIFNSSLYKSNLLQYALPESVVWRMLPSEMQFKDSEAISPDKVVDDHPSDYNAPVSLSAVQIIPDAIASNLAAVVLEHSCESDLSNSSSDSHNLSDLLGQYTYTDAQETMSDFLTFSCMDDMDEVIHCSLLYGENDDDVGHSGDTSDEIANLFMLEDVIEEPMIVSDDIYTFPTVAGTLFGFPVDCEPFSGYETYFPEENDNSILDFFDPNNYGCVSPTNLCRNEDLISNFDQSPWDYSGYFDERSQEDPLQDVVPSIFEQPDNVNACTIHSSVSSITSLVKNAAASSPALSLSEEATEESVPPTHALMSFFIGVDDFHHSITPTPSTKTGISMLAEEKKRKKHSHGPSDRGVQQEGVSKKARLNNGRKPRPKDRQLIQDRLKELRDLVPKGEKCSIDSLLDKAIKHMQFQANVTEQAEKLRYAVDKEILTGEKLTEVNNNHQKGSSSAIQDLKLFPVTVKDLSHPGSMLIEMVCNEEELFFEITKVLSHLGLTILKSIMDANSGNSTSAKFIVEAPRGFAKMEIFFPLLQLLQRRRNTMTPTVL
ncbi:hypothetical protein V2J09_010484 [Rumex salicifolius]